MGCFSYICKESGQSIHDGDIVKLFYLKGCQVVQQMTGPYSLYGNVYDENDNELSWNTEWSDIVNDHFNDNAGDGIAAICECEFTGKLPTTISDDCPNQGQLIDMCESCKNPETECSCCMDFAGTLMKRTMNK